MQLVCIHPEDESIVVSRYTIGDVDRMTKMRSPPPVRHNVYVEGRTVCKACAATSAAASKTPLGIWARCRLRRR